MHIFEIRTSPNLEKAIKANEKLTFSISRASPNLEKAIKTNKESTFSTSQASLPRLPPGFPQASLRLPPGCPNCVAIVSSAFSMNSRDQKACPAKEKSDLS